MDSPHDAFARSQAASTPALDAATDAARAAIDCGTSRLSDSHDDVADELDRLRRLLDDAIGQLSQTFRALHTLNAQQRSHALAAIDIARSDGCKHDGSLVTVVAHADEFDRHAVGAVTALQFQDLATQIVDNARKRLSHIRLLSSGLVTASSMLAQASRAGDPAPATAALEDVKRELDEVMHDASLVPRRGPVCADNLQPGDVELF